MIKFYIKTDMESNNFIKSLKVAGVQGKPIQFTMLRLPEMMNSYVEKAITGSFGQFDAVIV